MLSKSLLTSALVGLAAQATSAMLITPLIVESSHEVLLECAECTSVMKEPNVALQNLQIPSLVSLEVSVVPPIFNVLTYAGSQLLRLAYNPSISSLAQ